MQFRVFLIQIFLGSHCLARTEAELGQKLFGLGAMPICQGRIQGNCKGDTFNDGEVQRRGLGAV
jgi:hypothetical protein